jgi:hypothetical protein
MFAAPACRRASPQFVGAPLEANLSRNCVTKVTENAGYGAEGTSWRRLTAYTA